MSNTRYIPTITPAISDDIPEYLRKELDDISATIGNIADGHYDKTYVEPPRPRTGDIRYADGTEWNPGQGAGLYYYDGTRWVLYGNGTQGAGDCGQFVDFNMHTASTINTPTALTWGTTALSQGISIDDTATSRINFTHTGKYYVSFSAQLHSTNSSAKRMWLFPRINGVDVTGSTMLHTLKANDARRVVSRDGIFNVTAGDYLEAIFAVDDTGLELDGTAATAFAPAAPSVTISILQISA